MPLEIPITFSLFEAIFISLLISFVLAQISIRFARRVNLIDFPGSAPHKLHPRPTPLAGGIALISTLFVTEMLVGTTMDLNVKATFLAGIPVFIFGLWDDFKSISPPIKLGGQIIAAMILIRLGVYVQIFESPEFFIHGQGTLYVYLDWIVTILWVVGITNAFNFVDSMDGLAVGLGGIAAAFFMLVTLSAGQPVLSVHSAIIAGACAGLYFYNSLPALLFLGDSGAQTMGFILAVLAITYSPKGANQASSWLVPIMLLSVPMFDAALVIISRVRRKHPIYTAARDHTYHRLLQMGLASNRAVLVMQTTALALSCLAFVVLNQPPLIANTVFIILLLLGGLTLAILEIKQPDVGS
jgi:UDP-GlcNAc:undecaprenyl-phosphate GlcNAc-1-phosphate transferase